MLQELSGGIKKPPGKDRWECDHIIKIILPIKVVLRGQVVISLQHFFTKKRASLTTLLNTMKVSTRIISYLYLHHSLLLSALATHDYSKVFIVSMLFALASASGPACEVMEAIGGAYGSVQAACGPAEPTEVCVYV